MREEKIEIGSKWQHFKGSVVEVLLIAKNESDLEDMVIYNHDDNNWARKISSFLSDEDISIREDNVTKQKYRFEKIKEN